MNTSAFDPNLFLDAQVTEVNERRPPLPVENPASTDGLYIAVIGEIKMVSGTYEKGDNAGRPWLSAVIPLQFEVAQQVQDQLGLKLATGTLQLTHRVFIDLTPQNLIDNAVGRNRGQKQYREALDLNKTGDVWSWRKATGQAVKVKISHEQYDGNTQERIDNILRR